MSKKLLFNFNREVIQNYTYVKYAGTIITATNTLEKPIKSAILSGNTLVNLSCLKDINMQQNQTVKISTETVKKGTVYTFKFFVSKNNEAQRIRIRFYNGASLGVLSDYNIVDGLNNLKVTTKTEEECIYFSISNLSSEINIQDFIILEGDYTNQDIPYFEGMQSVKLPVLMTYTNLFTGFVAFGYINHGGNLVELQGNILSDFIEIHEKTIAFRTFRENGEPSTRHGEFAFYDNNKNFIDRKINSDTTDEYTTVPDGTKYVRIWSVPLDGLGLNTKGMMIYTKDKPSLAITKYLESNKTNILTVNEDVELGSVGEVKDELNLLTGQLTQRSETRAYQEGDEANSEVITDMANTRYKLAQEVVKTVDLSILDQNENKVSSISSFNDTTHIMASSETIPPTFEGYLATKEVE